jgi:hypothetical protein
MRRAVLAASACVLASRAAAAKPVSIFSGVVTAELPRGWHVDGARFVKAHGKGQISIELGITSLPARAQVDGFEEGAFDDIGPAGGIVDADVGGVRGLVATAGSDDEGAVLEAVDSCLGTITVRAAWFTDETAAERAQIRAIVKSVKLRTAGGGFADQDAAAIDPKARALAAHVVEALCADDTRALVALAGPVVRVRDAAHHDVGPEDLATEIAGAHGPRAFAAIPSGPFSLAARDDGSVDLFTTATPPAGAKDTGFVTLRDMNGAWRIAAIVRTLDSGQ